MPKIIKNIKKPPKSIKHFWDIFEGYNERLQEKLQELKVEIDKNKKHQTIKTTCAVIAVFATIISGFIAYGGLVGWFHPPIEPVEEPYIIADGNAYRLYDIESFIVKIRNVGDKSADNLQIVIDFPSNMTIFRIKDEQGIPLTEKTEGGVNYSYYYPFFENIKVNETIEFNLLLHNNYGDFIGNESWVIQPERIQVWANGDEIPISISYY